jgi:acyl dehydratase
MGKTMSHRWSPGATLDGKAHDITEAKLVAFERVIWTRVANVHNNPDVAKKVGMSRIIASGQNQLAFLHQLMETHFGDGWTHGGKIATRWICPVYVGDTITPHAAVREVTTQGDRRRVHLDVWCTNQSDVQTARGTAEAWAQ